MLRVIGAIALLLAAAFGTLVAVVTLYALCRDGTHVSCLRGPSFELVAQLVVATLGLGAAALLLANAVRDRPRRATRWLVVGLALYVGWAFLNDAAVHGWQSLRLLGQ